MALNREMIPLHAFLQSPRLKNYHFNYSVTAREEIHLISPQQNKNKRSSVISTGTKATPAAQLAQGNEQSEQGTG